MNTIIFLCITIWGLMSFLKTGISKLSLAFLTFFSTQIIASVFVFGAFLPSFLNNNFDQLSKTTLFFTILAGIFDEISLIIQIKGLRYFSENVIHSAK